MKKSKKCKSCGLTPTYTFEIVVRVPDVETYIWKETVLCEQCRSELSDTVKLVWEEFTNE